MAALEHGKHVLCEVRMAMDAAEARRMLDAARRAPHLVAQLVPAPNTLEVDATLQALIADGDVGEVLAVELHATQGQFLDPDAPLHWRQDASLSGLNVLTMGIWYESLMLWLRPARRVMAMMPDHVDVRATRAGGAVAHLHFSAITAMAPPGGVWIFGSEGTLWLEASAQRVSGARRGDRELREIPIPPERRIGWRVEDEFVNAIRGRETVSRTTFEDGVRYMEFTEAVARSAASGQAVDVHEL